MEFAATLVQLLSWPFELFFFLIGNCFLFVGFLMHVHVHGGSGPIVPSRSPRSHVHVRHLGKCNEQFRCIAVPHFLLDPNKASDRALFSDPLLTFVTKCEKHCS